MSRSLQFILVLDTQVQSFVPTKDHPLYFAFWPAILGGLLGVTGRWQAQFPLHILISQSDLILLWAIRKTTCHQAFIACDLSHTSDLGFNRKFYNFILSSSPGVTCRLFPISTHITHHGYTFKKDVYFFPRLSKEHFPKIFSWTFIGTYWHTSHRWMDRSNASKILPFQGIYDMMNEIDLLPALELLWWLMIADDPATLAMIPFIWKILLPESPCQKASEVHQVFYCIGRMSGISSIFPHPRTWIARAW